jgi:hypothetical protein
VQARLGIVKQPAYSSLEAFLAHYRALKSVRGAGAEERNLLGAMEERLKALRAEERLALDSDSADPAVARHRERARLRLGRELRARGILEG